MRVVIEPPVCSSIVSTHCGPGTVLRPPHRLAHLALQQFHLTVGKPRLREVTLPKVNLLVSGRAEVQTPGCLTAESSQCVVCWSGVYSLG